MSSADQKVDYPTKTNEGSDATTPQDTARLSCQSVEQPARNVKNHAYLTVADLLRHAPQSAPSGVESPNTKSLGGASDAAGNVGQSEGGGATTQHGETRVWLKNFWYIFVFQLRSFCIVSKRPYVQFLYFYTCLAARCSVQNDPITVQDHWRDCIGFKYPYMHEAVTKASERGLQVVYPTLTR